jgi:hypothetical protein
VGGSSLLPVPYILALTSSCSLPAWAVREAKLAEVGVVFAASAGKSKLSTSIYTSTAPFQRESQARTLRFLFFPPRYEAKVSPPDTLVVYESGGAEEKNSVKHSALHDPPHRELSVRTFALLYDLRPKSSSSSPPPSPPPPLPIRLSSTPHPASQHR